jgi:broad specificity phosphatase PhoE
MPHNPSRRQVWFIRHAQSCANAGLATTHPTDITLTEKGQNQALAIAQKIESAPDLIVTSPYVRTLETAQPTLAKFPNAEHAEWPIQEFTFLSPARCRGTTTAERLPWVKEYWARADPDYNDGDGAESFRVFVERVRDAWNTAQDSALGEFVLLFSHGQFMSALNWQLQNGWCGVDGESMLEFHRFHREFPVANGGVLKWVFECLGTENGLACPRSPYN